ncbi:MAG: hypothetical protein JXR37_06060 [Kiritimatiellae bacterium]|nr:hypothetical protein [Kiritimatiellia bacterium]
MTRFRLMRVLPFALLPLAAGATVRAAEAPHEGRAVNAGQAGNPYPTWRLGPGKDSRDFPIAVWLQDPKNAARYKAAGINLYVGLWKGPTEAQLTALKAAGMPVICAQNKVGLAHKDDPLIVAWMHGDEPDNAHKFKDYWKGDVEKIKAAWPEIEKFKPLGPDKPYKGYGPPVPPAWIVRDYEAIRARDPDRPVLLNLGQGVAWDGYIGRGERKGRLEDYPEYLKGCDVASFDIYPGCHDHAAVKGKLWYVPRGVERLRKWSGDRKVVWNCIECTRISNLKNRATPGQVRAEVWMSLIHGSMGLIYFAHQFKPAFKEAALLDDPDMLAEVTRINRQIHELAPALNSPSVPDLATVTTPDDTVPVAIMAKQVDGATYVFAVAMRGGQTEAAFTLHGVDGGKVDVLGESRTLELANGTFTDAFKDWDVHLYKVVP